jgi:predicted transcriptional regulator YdeE
MNPETSQIGKLFGLYFGQQMANQFKDRVSPGVTYSVYTEYESDEHGEYTYFLGEAVTSLKRQDQSTFDSLLVPPSTYQKFTTPPGKIPDIVIASWQDIWKMKEADLDGKRAYTADFEVYDERAHDPQNAVVDIYIGLKKTQVD